MRRRLFPLFALLSALLSTLLPAFVAAQPADPTAKPFQATAELGKPATVGSRRFVIGSQEEIEGGWLREVTLESATLAFVLATPEDNVVAGASEKLLILRAKLRNPEKTSNFNVSTSTAIGLRMWQRYTGTGKFQFVSHYDAETLRPFTRNLRSGESVRFVSVWRVPADFNDFRLGITTSTATIIPWYDLRDQIGKLQTVFAAPDGITALPSANVDLGKPFDMNGLELVVNGISVPTRLAGAAVTKPTFIVTVTATNRQMKQPVRWGWQHVTSELVDGSGQTVKGYPAFYNEATDALWSSDLTPGATVRTQLVYEPPPDRLDPRAFRLTFNESGRSVTVRLKD